MKLAVVAFMALVVVAYIIYPTIMVATVIHAASLVQGVK